MTRNIFTPSPKISFLSGLKPYLLMCISLLSVYYPVYGGGFLEEENSIGSVNVFGQLVEGACNLDMRSEFQEIQLGVIPKARLLQVGDEDLPVFFVLHFSECLRNGGYQVKSYHNALIWDSLQPVLSITFVAKSDNNIPNLIAVNGVTGVALKLQDSSNNQIYPGENGKPQFLSPENDQLVYKVTVVRTPATLSTGDFHAVVDFRINYE